MICSICGSNDHMNNFCPRQEGKMENEKDHVILQPGNWSCDKHNTYMADRTTPCPYCEINRLRSEVERLTKERDTFKNIVDANTPISKIITEDLNCQEALKAERTRAESAEKELARYRVAIHKMSLAYDTPTETWLQLADEELYPCADCGKLRTAAEGGTTFTVCDECWDKHYNNPRPTRG